MNNSQIIFNYFPNLSACQTEQINQLYDLYVDWNNKINVISRKDIENLYCHHVLHSLSIAKVISFRPGTKILDFGTGGGFPGIPLAILFPDVEFTLIDSIGKKTKVAQAVAEAIGLKNVRVFHKNIIEEKEKYDFVVCRAVTNTNDLVRLVRKNVASAQRNSLPNGIICLKGGDLSQELKSYRNSSETWDLSQYFTEEFFETKHVVYIHI